MNDTSAHSSKPEIHFRDMWRLLSGYWRSSDKKLAWLLLLLLPALEGVTVYQALLMNRQNGAIFDAIGAYDLSGFWRQTALMAVVMMTWVIVQTVVEWVLQILQMRWRTWMTGHFTERWLARKTYYRLDRSEVIDNPDQRLSDDMRVVTEQGLKYALQFYGHLSTIIVFSAVLWNLSSPFSFTLFGWQITIPGFILWAFLLFCLASTGLVEWLGRPLLRARYRQHAREGDFRFGLVRVRENVEPIALYAGEEAEQKRLYGAFSAIRNNWRQVVLHTRNVNFATYAGNQAAQIIPKILGVGGYFAGTLTLGGFTRVIQTCNQLRIALLWFIQMYPELADVRAALARLCEMDRLLDAAEVPHDIKVADSQDDVLRTYDLVLESPGGRALSRPSSLDIRPGSNCVIVGPSGCGKSTFLLALAGLWRHGHGRIEMPVGQRSMFIPQRPYVPIGTFKDALCYPGTADEFSNEECVEVLKACCLEHYIDRLEEAAHWSKRLSPGEQQRLAFGRVLLQKPDLLFLDESTSALDPQNEKAMYARVKERLPGCTVVSVAHRESVKEMHQRVLDFTPATSERVLVPV